MSITIKQQCEKGVRNRCNKTKSKKSGTQHQCKNWMEDTASRVSWCCCCGDTPNFLKFWFWFCWFFSVIHLFSPFVSFIQYWCCSLCKKYHSFCHSFHVGVGICSFLYSAATLFFSFLCWLIFCCSSSFAAVIIIPFLVLLFWFLFV